MRRRIVLGIAVLAAALAGAVYLVPHGSAAPDGKPVPEETRGVTAPAPIGAMASKATASLPTPALGAVEDRPGTPFCDEGHWTGVRPMIVSVSTDAVIVKERDWTQRSLSGQVGIAGWLSQCLLDGRAFSIQSESAALLATYDPDRGYRPAS